MPVKKERGWELISGKLERFSCGSCNPITSNVVLGSPRLFVLLTDVRKRLGGLALLPFLVCSFLANSTQVDNSASAREGLPKLARVLRCWRGVKNGISSYIVTIILPRIGFGNYSGWENMP